MGRSQMVGCVSEVDSAFNSSAACSAVSIYLVSIRTLTALRYALCSMLYALNTETWVFPSRAGPLAGIALHHIAL